MTTSRILVAGVGNLFCGDDAFGIAVVRELSTDIIHGVVVRDFGLRARDLAFELQEGYDGLILIDATSRGGVPGTLYLIEPDVSDLSVCEGHHITPNSVLALARALGHCPRTIVVGCEPASLEPAERLSPAVESAVVPATQRIRQLIVEWATLKETQQ